MEGEEGAPGPCPRFRPGPESPRLRPGPGPERAPGPARMDPVSFSYRDDDDDYHRRSLTNRADNITRMTLTMVKQEKVIGTVLLVIATVILYKNSDISYGNGDISSSNGAVISYGISFIVTVTVIL